MTDARKPTPRPTPHAGKLLVLTPGMGAVATTFIAGVEAVRRGLAKPFGSITQLQTIRLGRRSDNRQPLIRDLLDLAPLGDLCFAGWDVFEGSAYETARRAEVLDSRTLDPLADFLHEIKPMRAAFDQEYVRRLDGPNVKPTKSKRELAEMLRQDICDAISKSGA